MFSSLNFIFLLASVSLIPNRPQDAVTAFVDVTVIPMDRERVLEHQVVLVQGSRITAIGPVRNVRVPSGARRVDGHGKFLIPGLADMHAHMGPSIEAPAPDSVAERVLFLYLANGVTTIRNMGGYAGILTLRQRMEKGELLGPWIYTAGPPLNETSPLEEIAKQKAAGYDFVKLYPFMMQSGAFHDFMAAAHQAGMRVAGHVSPAVGIEEALQGPYSSIEHLYGYIDYLKVPTDDDGPFRGLIAGPNGQFMEGASPGPLDESKLPSIAAATAHAGVWNSPTLAAFENMVVDTGVLMQRPEMRYVSEGTLARWSKERAAGDFAEPAIRWQNEIKLKIVKALHDAGAGLLLGTDAGPSYAIPGFSIHRELELLVAAGLTPYHALETGTRNPAVFFGIQDRVGSIAVDKRADLVLLDGNPLLDIRHTAHPAGVMIRGAWLPREEIDAQLATMLHKF